VDGVGHSDVGDRCSRLAGVVPIGCLHALCTTGGAQQVEQTFIDLAGS
jgi:hypothetical protein